MWGLFEAEDQRETEGREILMGTRIPKAFSDFLKYNNYSRNNRIPKHNAATGR